MTKTISILTLFLAAALSAAADNSVPARLKASGAVLNEIMSGGDKAIPQDLLDKLPPAEGYAKAVFPTLEQQSKAKQIISTQWDTVVGVEVEK